MTNAIHQSLLQEIGQSLDIDLEFDENHQCFLLLDEQLMVSIRSLDDAWVFYGMVGNLYPEDVDEGDAAQQNDETENTAQALLSLNLSQAESGGASIAMQKSSGVIMLVLRVATIGMYSLGMKDRLAGFVDQLKATIATLNGETEVPEKEAALPVFPLATGFFERA